MNLNYSLFSKMLKKFFSYLWSMRRQFAKYFIAGSSAVILDIGTLMLLKELLGIRPWVATIFNQALVLVYVFSIHKYWSFRNHELPHRQIIRFFILVSWNYVFSVAMMYLFNERAKIDYRLVRVGTIALAVSWNFFLYKYWVYQHHDS